MPAAVWLSLLVLLAPASSKSVLRFVGEVASGQKYRHPIGRGLELVLDPERAMDGWMIVVQPENDSCGDFASVIATPIRGRNPTYLDTSYGVSAQDVVKGPPHEFDFVLNCDDYMREDQRGTILLWPYTHKEAEVDRARAEFHSSPTGRGRLKILDYKISPSGETTAGKDFGRIDWLKFEVEITLPPAKPARKR